MMHSLLIAAAFAGVVAALCSLPGTLELLFLTFGGVLPPRAARANQGIFPKSVAIVVPAHNEELSIGQCVKSLLACDASPYDVTVFVIADNCTDSTAAQAAQAGARVLIRTDETYRGKGYALDFAFRQLTPDYDYFIVIDADSTVTLNLVSDFSKAISEGAAALQCRYKVRNAQDSARTRWMNIALMAFNVLRPRGRDRLGVSAGVLGNGFALTRATLEKVPYAATSVVEDLEYHLRLVQAGIKVRFVDSVTVYGEMPAGGKAAATQRSRWEGGRLHMLLHSAPGLIGQVLRGRVRLLEPLMELLLLPLAFHVSLLLVALISPLGMVRLYAALGLSVVLTHLLAAIAVGGGSWSDLTALLSAPFYVAWKLRVIPQLILNSRKNAAWVRTARVQKEGAQ